MDIIDRFIKYIGIDTVSDPNSDAVPSTSSQLELAKILVEDLHEIGLNDAYVDEFGYVYAHLDLKKEKTIGLIAHMDTAPDFKGAVKNVKKVENYDGSVVFLDSGDKLDPKDFPVLNEVIGEDLLFTDGNHLLGGDDKAGIAIIFGLISDAINNKDDYNANIALCFTVDEEIGRGADHFSKEKLGADIAFTLDGGSIYDANVENFNAAHAIIKIKGVSVHPGSAKNIMINAISVASKFHSLLPSEMVPEKTDEYEGFIHLDEMKGDVNEAYMYYIIRDHDKKLFEDKKELMLKIKDELKKENPRLDIEITIEDDYYNMWEYFISHREAINLINKAYLDSKEPIKYSPIRGGTDGARITFMGLPCPNLGVGDFNAHGKYEFVSITQMKKMVKILKNLAKLN